MKNYIALTFAKQETTDEIVKEHVGYLRELAANKQFILAGPYVDAKDDEVGVFMFKAADKAAAEAVLTNDPFIAKGFQRYELRELKIATEESGFKPE